MTGGLTPQEALARVPGLDVGAARVEEIAGGRSNRSYLVHLPNRKLVLRLATPDSNRLRPEPGLEQLIQDEAARRGLAPAIVHAETEPALLLSEYLPGRPLDRNRLRNRGILEMTGRLLRAVHQLPLSGRRFPREAWVEHYLALLGGREDLLPMARRCRDIVEAGPQPSSWACCHNDVVAANIVSGHASLKLVDWEYACDNEPMFDVASLVGYHDLGQSETDVLLASACDLPLNEARSQLEEQLRVFDALHWLWLAARQALAGGTAEGPELQKLASRIA